ncbi:hypothetical protein TPHA_0G00100 [Tetrapisispora phaffii CBS 4417]|uniref:Uncharacterized protein n=1 Tax=Tetrapisispora phaffii (strain ATCC 24235 / CBS 4417 / NBRC 1672 / NRRL Y-8282 / UCD 70-5) TaxID=1071381 RepID=G8BVC3_TETPH|nr:hypothetical protein TPHA_0G00100 [Tetrapisispora phaffii CBS 4417]CCE63851.1 hypothetical protein TPHA_0G00100 [Tetrapisispora phaffii CBS 4417]
MSSQYAQLLSQHNHNRSRRYHVCEPQHNHPSPPSLSTHLFLHPSHSSHPTIYHLSIYIIHLSNHIHLSSIHYPTTIHHICHNHSPSTSSHPSSHPPISPPLRAPVTRPAHTIRSSTQSHSVQQPLLTRLVTLSNNTSHLPAASTRSQILKIEN